MNSLHPAVFLLGKLRLNGSSLEAAGRPTRRGTIPGLDVLISEVAGCLGSESSFL